MEEAKKLLRDQGLNPDNFEIRSVNVRSKTRDELGGEEALSVSAKPFLKFERAVQSRIKPAKVKKQKRNYKVAVVLPDPQIGFRFYQDNLEYDPFHDLRAMELALQLVHEIQPDVIVNLGDFLDLPSLSRFTQEPTFRATMNQSIQAGYEFLASQRANSPSSQIILIEGNHEFRLNRYLYEKAPELAGLTQGGTGAAVVDVPYLLNCDSLDIEYIAGYPVAEWYLNDQLKFKHGDCVSGAGKTAAKVVENESVSTIFGHVHRIETAYKSTHGRYGQSTKFAHTPGCLCRVDGAVPGVHAGTSQGRPLVKYQNWQQSISLVYYTDDEVLNIENLPFNNYQTFYNGRIYEG